MLQDSLTQADSLATAVGATAGAFIALKAAAGLSFISKWLTEFLKKPAAWLAAKWGGLASWQKMVLSMLVGQAVVMANAWLSAHGLPALPTDAMNLPNWANGIIVGFMAMGWNAAKDAVFGKPAAPVMKAIKK